MNVQKRIGELLAAGRYLNRQEAERLPAFAEEQEEKRRLQAAEMARPDVPQPDASSGLSRPDAQAESEHTPVNRERARYGYDAGSTVWIGADEYEVVQLEQRTVVLQDRQFPLFIKELNRRDFERMLRENPLNDHLITGEQESERADEAAWETAEDAVSPEEPVTEGREPISQPDTSLSPDPVAGRTAPARLSRLSTTGLRMMSWGMAAQKRSSNGTWKRFGC